ncbi:MAG: type III pantothenate kinase [Myxococcales bacterium]|nr:type III pantothenate kinase [Myxococcales bacterium]
MLVTVDVGNSKTELGLWRGSVLSRTVRTSTHDDQDWGEWVVAALAGDGPIEGLVLGAVVPAAIPRWADVAARLGVPFRNIDGNNIPGLPIRLHDRAAIGADRVLNTLGALSLGPAPCIVVDLGTATTFDVVDASGTFCGGAIAPGAGTALDALVATTARLPRVPLRAPVAAIGTDTLSAMQSGAVFGYAGLVEGLLARIKGELGAPAWVVATGGLAPLLAPLCPGVDRVEPALTLRGLRRAWELWA